MAQIRKTICNRDCPDACGIDALVEDGKVVRLQGDRDHPITRGFLCYRTALFPSLQNAPDRITTPLLRVKGELRPVSWDEALDFAAERLAAVRAESGPAAIFHYRSGGSLGALGHLCDYFFEQFGPVTIKRGDICGGAGEAAQEMDFGEHDSNDVFDLVNARHIILWGKNPFISSPHLVPILREAKRGGARLVQVDPVLQQTSSVCESYLQPRPGGDFALAMAVARVLFERGWTDPEALARCDNLSPFRALVESRTVEKWCQEADVEPEQAQDLAERLGPGRPTALLVGWGMGRRCNGSSTVRALDALGAISGNLGVPGGGVSFYFRRRRAFDTSFIGGSQAAPRTICEPRFGQEVLALSAPPVRVVWITAANPVVNLPESDTVARALDTRELVVVVDPFWTDTARHAHLVLPTTTLLEADDLVGAYGHHWIGVSRPVVAPPPGVRSDLEIMQGLAERLGLAAVMAGSARAWKRRMLDSRLAAHGITLERLEEGPVRNPLAPRILFEGGRFPTPTGRVNLLTGAPPAPSIDADYPLFMMALSTEKSQCGQWAVPPEDPAVVTVHPSASGGVGDGQLALLESRIGSMRVRVCHDDGQRHDVALMAKGGHHHPGRCANALLRAALTDQGEGAALYDEAVRLVPIAGSGARGRSAPGAAVSWSGRRA